MDNITLRKKLSTYLSAKGQLRNIGEEVLYEVLRAWEEWPGSAKDFYKSIGFSYRQMAGVIGKAKKLKREGYFGSETFKEVVVDGESASSDAVSSSSSDCNLIELEWQPGKVIRFPRVKQLLEFLQKVG